MELDIVSKYSNNKYEVLILEQPKERKLEYFDNFVVGNAYPETICHIVNKETEEKLNMYYTEIGEVEEDEGLHLAYKCMYIGLGDLQECSNFSYYPSHWINKRLEWNYKKYPDFIVKCFHEYLSSVKAEIGDNIIASGETDKTVENVQMEYLNSFSEVFLDKAVKEEQDIDLNTFMTEKHRRLLNFYDMFGKSRAQFLENCDALESEIDYRINLMADESDLKPSEDVPENTLQYAMTGYIKRVGYEIKNLVQERNFSSPYTKLVKTRKFLKELKEDIEKDYELVGSFVEKEKTQKGYLDKADDTSVRFMHLVRDKLRYFSRQVEIKYKKKIRDQILHIDNCIFKDETFHASSRKELKQSCLDDLERMYLNMIDYQKKGGTIEGEVKLAGQIANNHRKEMTKKWNEDIQNDPELKLCLEALDKRYADDDEAKKYLMSIIGRIARGDVSGNRIEGGEEIYARFNKGYNALLSIFHDLKKSEDSFSAKDALVRDIQTWYNHACRNKQEVNGYSVFHVDEDNIMYKKYEGNIFRSKAIEALGKFKLIGYFTGDELGEEDATDSRKKSYARGKIGERGKLHLDIINTEGGIYINKDLAPEFKITDRV